MAEEPPFIQVHGQVVLEGRRLYYFFDTRDGRWFALAEGDVDERSGLTLLGSREGEEPVLMDLREGSGSAIRGREVLRVKGASRS